MKIHPHFGYSIPQDTFSTPIELYESLHKEFHFDYDPCPLNIIPEIDGLNTDWGWTTYVNPPYSNPNPWILKAIKESKKGKTIVMLLKCDTSTKAFHELIVPNCKEIRFIKGRLRYSGLKPAPFPSIIVVF